MARSTLIKVQKLLARNWDGKADLNQYMEMASSTVDSVVLDAIAKGQPLSDAQQELTERALACHYYTKYDPLYTSKSTGGASGSFVASSKEPERYKELAINMDVSGCLVAILNRQTAGGFALNRILDCP